MDTCQKCNKKIYNGTSFQPLIFLTKRDFCICNFKPGKTHEEMKQWNKDNPVKLVFPTSVDEHLKVINPTFKLKDI